MLFVQSMASQTCRVVHTVSAHGTWLHIPVVDQACTVSRAHLPHSCSEYVRTSSVVSVCRDEAELDEIIGKVIHGAFYQSGQSCISVQRLFVRQVWFGIWP